MFTVAFLAQKGGVGKTTLALTLATAAELDGLSVGVLDCDPSANADGWRERRERMQEKETPDIGVAGDPDTLREAVETAKAARVDWLFIDTGAGVGELPAKAAELADLILIPCVGTANNISGVGPTAELVTKEGKRGFFIVNRGRNSKALNDACALALTSTYGLPAVATHISHRLPIGDAEDSGLTILEVNDPSAETSKKEFRALWKWLRVQQGRVSR